MDRKLKKDLLKIFIFISAVNIPFICMIQLIGIDTFLDSFEFPESYNYFKISQYESENVKGDYIVVQKVFHPNFSILEGDEILYLKDGGGLLCKRAYYDINIGEKKQGYVTTFNEEINNKPLYEYQIIGKVVNSIDNNLWNSLSLKIWDISINNLNIVALFTIN